MTMTEEKTLTLKIYDRALDTMADMVQQADAVDSVWGSIRPTVVLRTYQSLARQTARLFNAGFGDADLYRDGEVSLFVRTTSGFVFGMIGHRIDYQPDTPAKEDGIPTMGVTAPVMGVYCMAQVEGREERYCCKPVRQRKPTCEHDTPVLFSLPVPIEWSFHS